MVKPKPMLVQNDPFVPTLAMMMAKRIIVCLSLGRPGTIFWSTFSIITGTVSY